MMMDENIQRECTTTLTVSLDALFASTENICAGNLPLAETIFDIINITVASEYGTPVERTQARSQAILAKMRGTPDTDDTVKEGVMNTSQIAICFYYFFNKLGITFSNSDKSSWIRLIHSITGKNEKNIRQRLNFDFDSNKTRKDIRIAAEHLTELFPSIVTQMEKDIADQ